MLKISGGPLDVVGSLTIKKRGTVLSPENAFVEAPTTDFNGVPFDIDLNSSLITGPGTYALVYSPVPLTDYVGAGTVSWIGPSSGTATVITGAGNGTYVNIDGSDYFAVVVTVA